MTDTNTAEPMPGDAWTQEQFAEYCRNALVSLRDGHDDAPPKAIIDRDPLLLETAASELAGSGV